MGIQNQVCQIPKAQPLREPPSRGKEAPWPHDGHCLRVEMDEHTHNSLQAIEDHAQSCVPSGTESDFQGGGDGGPHGQGQDALPASDLPGRWTPSSQ